MTYRRASGSRASIVLESSEGVRAPLMERRSCRVRAGRRLRGAGHAVDAVLEVPGQGRVEGDGRSGLGVGEGDARGMQGVARQAQADPGRGLQTALAEAVEVAGVRPVHLVAHEGE